MLVPVIAAALFLPPWQAAAVTALAVVSRVPAMVVHDYWPWALLADSVAYIAAAAVILASRRLLARRARSEAISLQGTHHEGEELGGLGETPTLTARERQVLSLTQRGLTASQIGSRLFIGRRTVESHLEAGYRKLGIHSKHELIERAVDDAGPLTQPAPPSSSNEAARHHKR